MKKILLALALALAMVRPSTAALPGNEGLPVNPILPGFNPDPSICRVGDDYYLCCSSFTWYPGLPVYHSRDLVNWRLVSHVISRPGMVDIVGQHDTQGVWAPTIRHHNGVFYVFCNVKGGGNFYVTSRDIRGPWSDPVFIKDAPGIDPSIFWDDNGKAYLMGNAYKFPGRKYQASTAIWMQEIDLADGRLIGERHYLTTGHALNARYSEGAHLYKINGRYVLTVAEGGTDFHHAVTLLTSKSLFGPYLPQMVNPVLSQRQFGHECPIQCVGHADLVQTQRGDWYAVALGKRMIDGKHAFTRETFICPVEIQDGEFIFNPGRGGMTTDMPRPNLPEHKWAAEPLRQEFCGAELPLGWYSNRIPARPFHSLKDGRLLLELLPQTIGSLDCPAMLMRRTPSLSYSASTSLSFAPKKRGEVAGLVLHRNNTAYVALLKSADSLLVVESGRQTHALAYAPKEVCLRINVSGTDATLECGETEQTMRTVAEVSLVPLADKRPHNRFNGPGVGVYASSGGKKTKATAQFHWFELTDN